jgi:hypothetical protein
MWLYLTTLMQHATNVLEYLYLLTIESVEPYR